MAVSGTYLRGVSPGRYILWDDIDKWPMEKKLLSWISFIAEYVLIIPEHRKVLRFEILSRLYTRNRSFPRSNSIINIIINRFYN